MWLYLLLLVFAIDGAPIEGQEKADGKVDVTFDMIGGERKTITFPDRVGDGKYVPTIKIGVTEEWEYILQNRNWQDMKHRSNTLPTDKLIGHAMSAYMGTAPFDQHTAVLIADIEVKPPSQEHGPPLQLVQEHEPITPNQKRKSVKLVQKNEQKPKKKDYIDYLRETMPGVDIWKHKYAYFVNSKFERDSQIKRAADDQEWISLAVAKQLWKDLELMNVPGQTFRRSWPQLVQAEEAMGVFSLAAMRNQQDAPAKFKKFEKLVKKIGNLEVRAHFVKKWNKHFEQNGFDKKYRVKGKTSKETPANEEYADNFYHDQDMQYVDNYGFDGDEYVDDYGINRGQYYMDDYGVYRNHVMMGFMWILVLLLCGICYLFMISCSCFIGWMIGSFVKGDMEIKSARDDFIDLDQV